MKTLIHLLFLAAFAVGSVAAQYACSGDQFMNGTIASIGLQCASPSASGYMKGANNLSDISSAGTSRSNLGLATVAATGAYSDLSGKPTIPAAQVQSDWNASTGLGVILNKPTIPTLPKLYVGTSSTTGTGGIATFNITAAGFSAAPTACLFNATTGTGTPANSYNAVGLVATAWTSTQVQAYVTQPISILIGGLGVGNVGAGVTVQAVCYP